MSTAEGRAAASPEEAAGAGTAGGPNTTIRVALSAHLRELARVERSEVQVEVEGRPTARALLDALEARYPALRGTIRDHDTGARRAYMRYFACGADVSHESPEQLLPRKVVRGEDVFRILGAIAGG